MDLLVPVDARDFQIEGPARDDVVKRGGRAIVLERALHEGGSGRGISLLCLGDELRHQVDPRVSTVGDAHHAQIVDEIAEAASHVQDAHPFKAPARGELVKPEELFAFVPAECLGP